MLEDKNGSFFTVDKNILKCKAITPYAIAVYNSICSHANNETGECFPSIKTIGFECGIKSEKTVRKTIDYLIDSGFIVKETRTFINGFGKTQQLSNLYTRKAFGSVSVDNQNDNKESTNASVQKTIVEKNSKKQNHQENKANNRMTKNGLIRMIYEVFKSFKSLSDIDLETQKMISNLYHRTTFGTVIGDYLIINNPETNDTVDEKNCLEDKISEKYIEKYNEKYNPDTDFVFEFDPPFSLEDFRMELNIADSELLEFFKVIEKLLIFLPIYREFVIDIFIRSIFDSQREEITLKSKIEEELGESISFNDIEWIIQEAKEHYFDVIQDEYLTMHDSILASEFTIGIEGMCLYKANTPLGLLRYKFREFCDSFLADRKEGKFLEVTEKMFKITFYA